MLKTLNKEGIKRIAIVGFEKRFLYSLTVFQFFFFVTFNLMLRRHICWTRSCNFNLSSITSNFIANLKSHSTQGSMMAMLTILTVTQSP